MRPAARSEATVAESGKRRCDWVEETNELYVAYHDREWGVPVHDERTLFEFLILEGAQAGLSWATVLKKRENYRLAFDGFDPQKIAGYGKRQIQKLLKNEGIIRNRLKVESAVGNAQAFLDIQAEFGSFDRYVWEFVGGSPIQNAWKKLGDAPAVTPVAETMSRDLKKRGLRFVGPTICYAFMQATGMVNDHTTDCFRYNEIVEIVEIVEIAALS